ncbi:MAG: hypothetical protein RL261_1235 [Pseudomonadota bacterium]|jgi:hypothetical protein
MVFTSIPSINAWIRADETATAESGDELHDDTVAKVPVINRFMHNQKPPSSQISTFNFFRSLLRKMKQSPVYGSCPNSCSTTHDNESIPRRISCAARATKIRRIDEKFSTGPSSATQARSTAMRLPDPRAPQP